MVDRSDGFRRSVAKFVAQDLRPHTAHWEASGSFPRAALAQCARRGYFELDGTRSAILTEELPTCESLGFALSVFVQANLVAPLIRELGSEAQKRQFGSLLLRGRGFGCLAVSEPGAGSDLAGLQSEARPASDRLVLNGRKTYITNAAIADFAITAVRIVGRDPEALSLVLLPLHTRGVRVKRLPTLGLVTSAMGTIEFRNCRIPADAILGQADHGFVYVQRALNRERLLGGIAAVGWAQYALDRTIRFTRDRQAFGHAIGRFQAVRHQLAEAAARLEAARQLNYATHARWLRNEDVTREICMIKLISYQAAQDVITTCVQLHGALGYLDGHWTSRFYRDARALTIAAGTPEVMKEIIAAYLRI